METKNIIVGLLGVLTIVFGVAYLKQTVVNITTPAPEVTTYGATPGPDINSPYLNHNGVVTWSYSARVRPSAVNLCTFKSPNATTTIPVGGATLGVLNVLGTNTFEIGQSWTAGATTTRLAIGTVLGSQYGEIIATTTMTALTDGKVSPNTFISYNLATGTPGTTALSGRCNLRLIEL